MAFTKQPVLSSNPKMLFDQNAFDPPLANYTHDIQSGHTPYVIFDAGNELSGNEGGMIHRITVTACGDATTNTTVNEKLVFLYIKAAGQAVGYRWNLYKTAVLYGATVSNSVPNPEIVWEFKGGLLVSKGSNPDYTQLGIRASTNYDQTICYGDYLSCVVEYTDNALM